jgi:large subunit ribosomal protein L4
VSGGGKKPWKQKGTGRARAGSSRSPLWPAARSSSARSRATTTTAAAVGARAALCCALAARHGEGTLVVVDALVLPEPKTKRMVEALSGLGIEGSALVVLAREAIACARARNLPK